MQKTVFSSIVFLFIWTGNLRTQNVPFPESSAIWKEQHTTIGGPIFNHVTLCGDTLLNGTNYSQLLDLQVDSAMNITNSTFVGGIRSNGSVVRFLPNDGSPELLLYDFSLEAGDVIDLTQVFFSDPVSREVDSVKVEMLGTRLRAAPSGT